MGTTKDAKRKGPQTTKPGTRAYRTLIVGQSRPGRAWSARRRWGELVIQGTQTGGSKSSSPRSLGGGPTSGSEGS